MSSSLSIVGTRAGFWRRTLATVIDELVVALPVQLILAVLFALSSGWIQGSVGLAFPKCAVSAVADGQAPSTSVPHIGMDCSFSFFGLEAKHVLMTWQMPDLPIAKKAGIETETQVAASAKQFPPAMPTAMQTMLDSEGHPVKGIALDWVGLVALLIYFVAFQTQTGRTLGDRVVGIRLVDSSDGSSVSVSLRRVIVRFLALDIGFYPQLIVGVLGYATNWNALSFRPGSPFFILFLVTAIANLVWSVTLVVQIARKRDPYYDRIAGTAVLRN